MDAFPSVTAICPTYARPHLLEEAIHGFLLQDYPGKKELVIVNDYDQQTLVFEHPEVKIFNVSQRYPSLGEKRNATIACASHDLICVWDDDDICLPHRISTSVTHIKHSGGYFKQGMYAPLLNDGAITSMQHSFFHCSAMFTRDLFVRAGGYPAMGSGEDVALERIFIDLIGPQNVATLTDPSEYFYLYRWGGTNSYHASWYEDKPEASTNDRVASYASEALARGEIAKGIIPLTPHWKTDYLSMNRAFIQSL